MGYIVDEAVNRQGKSTQSVEVWKKRGKPGWESGHFEPHRDDNRTYKYDLFQGDEKDINTEEQAKHFQSTADRVVEYIAKKEA